MRTLAVLIVIGGITWSHLWFTPDQQGQRLLDRGEFQAAAEAFRDPMWQGVAWFRAGEFEKAERAFARVATPEAEYNRGNCLVMQGNYEAAIERYDRALQLRPELKDAQVNREIAVVSFRLLQCKQVRPGAQRERLESARPASASVWRLGRAGLLFYWFNNSTGWSVKPRRRHLCATSSKLPAVISKAVDGSGIGVSRRTSQPSYATSGLTPIPTMNSPFAEISSGADKFHPSNAAPSPYCSISNC